MTGTKLVNAGENALIDRRAHRPKEIAYGFPIQNLVESGTMEHNLQLGAKDQTAARFAEVERLHSQPVSRNKKPFPAVVPQREDKHAPHLFDAGIAVLLVQMDNHLCIRVGIETMALTLENRSKSAKVVDLPIEDDPHGPVFVMDGLLARCQNDDAKPTHSEADAGRYVVAVVVGTAVNHGIAHRADFRFENRPFAEAHNACYAAHGFVTLFSLHRRIVRPDGP